MKGKKRQIRKPRKVSIMGVEWEIIYKRIRKDGDELFGYTNDIVRQIIISDYKTSLQVQKETLLHEIMHACYMDYTDWYYPDSNIEDKAEHVEEESIRHLSTRLFQCLRDNPDIKQFIFTKE